MQTLEMVIKDIHEENKKLNKKRLEAHLHERMEFIMAIEKNRKLVRELKAFYESREN
jgi:hypothetical protein